MLAFGFRLSLTDDKDDVIAKIVLGDIPREGDVKMSRSRGYGGK